MVYGTNRRHIKLWRKPDKRLEPRCEKFERCEKCERHSAVGGWNFSDLRALKQAQGDKFCIKLVVFVFGFWRGAGKGNY